MIKLGDLVTRLNENGCPTTEPSIVVRVGFRNAVLLEPNGSMPTLPLKCIALWIPPPPNYQWPKTERVDGGRPFNNKIGFLRT